VERSRMARIAVLGANGQVGAEICLLLSKSSDVELVAICRNRSGSAFLRWQGIACRHGRPADAADAPRLFGDCDIILNFALASGNPAQIRSTEDQLIHNSFACSKPEAIVVYFSTQSVYGDPSPARRLRWRNPYGRAKLVSESRVLAGTRRWRKPTFILRLGHVCGELQSISLNMRHELLQQRAVLPLQDVPSNTVLTVAILDAIEQIVQGQIRPGTYDLMNTPQWSWRQVYRYEAERCGAPFNPTFAGPAARRPAGQGWRLLAMARKLAAGRWNRELLAKLLAYAPASVSRRAQAIWYCQRARAEIAALAATGLEPAEHLSWVTNGERPLPQRSTVELLQADPYGGLLDPGMRPRWPSDLPDAAFATAIRVPEAPQAQID
jgi:nucleoside-diphosphate-sugar epimerase